MRTIEFWCAPTGEVRYKMEGKQEKKFTKFSTEIIEELLTLISERFPLTMKRLEEKHGKCRSELERRYRMTENFIRCNFGSHDLLSYDMVEQHINLEEVKCPLRGKCWLCQDEGIICKPKDKLQLSPAEREVVGMYAEGKSVSIIASILGKSKNTVNQHLYRVCKRLGLASSHALLAYIIEHNISL